MVSLKKILNKILENKANEPILLWENASPRSVFASQTIDLDLSGYDAVEIVFVRDTSSSGNVYTFTEKIKKWKASYVHTLLNPNSSDPETALSRIVPSIQDTGILFDDGYSKIMTSMPMASIDNSIMIPYKIYGIKGV